MICSARSQRSHAAPLRVRPATGAAPCAGAQCSFRCCRSSVSGAPRAAG
jgi:hypothetical protein